MGVANQGFWRGVMLPYKMMIMKPNDGVFTDAFMISYTVKIHLQVYCCCR